MNRGSRRPARVVTVEVLESRWLLSADFSNAGVLGLEDVCRPLNFALTEAHRGVLTGMVFRDTNGNRVWDPGETPLSGITVFIDSNENGILDEGELSTTTGLGGTYRFEGLGPGPHLVRPDSFAELAASFSAFGANGSSLVVSPITTTGSDAVVYSTSSLGGDGGTIQPLLAESTSLVRLDEFHIDPRFAGITGIGYSVVVLDTGIDLDHPFFGPDTNGDGVADRIVYNQDFIGGGPNAADARGHGTHVTSIVASQDATYPGIAPEVDIIHLKVLGDNGVGSFSALEDALQWVIANAEQYNILAINMSLGDDSNRDTPQSAYGIGDELAALAAQGIIVVSAAGNDYYEYSGIPGVGYPAADPNSLAVGSVWDGYFLNVSWSGGAEDYSTAPDRLVSHSQRHPQLTEVFAPGAMITAADIGGGTRSSGGTSMAAPHVAGAATLAQQLALQSLGRRLTLEEFRQILADSNVAIFDGDEQDDNVINTQEAYGRLDLVAMGEAILSLAGLGVADVIGRHVFYNNSAFDGNNPGIDAADANAIATDKTPYLADTGQATFANYTSYDKGINGLIIDVMGLGDPQGLSLADFEFRTGNNNSPHTWIVAPDPLAMAVAEGAGANGSDRITLVWADNNLDGTIDPNEAIAQAWLEVRVLATLNTGLGSDDVFYFGNAVGESGSIAGMANVNATDELDARNNHTTFPELAEIDNPYDYNRDGVVDATDESIARNNGTNFQSQLILPTLGRVVAYFADMDTDPGWTLTGGANGWQYGPPQPYTDGPPSAATGENVLGFNLKGNYPNNMAVPEYATTPVIDILGLTDLTLEFQRWLGVEESVYDKAGIEFSIDGSPWQLLWQHGALEAIVDTNWVPLSYAIPGNGNDLQIRWFLGPTDFSVTYAGWNIDDVVVWGMVSSESASGPMGSTLSFSGSSPAADPASADSMGTKTLPAAFVGAFVGPVSRLSGSPPAVFEQDGRIIFHNRMTANEKLTPIDPADPQAAIKQMHRLQAIDAAIEAISDEISPPPDDDSMDEPMGLFDLEND